MRTSRRSALGSGFYAKPALMVARKLLGKFLVRRIGRKETAFMITEVEAYIGPHDRASHASKGLTPRTKVMFGPPGYWYVYFTYGMHWMLNVVTGKRGHPAAVLIRGVEGISGPARITKRLRIDKKLNEKRAVIASGLWIEDRGVPAKSAQVSRAPRIGVGYAGPWARKPYRFLLASGLTRDSGKR